MSTHRFGTVAGLFTTLLLALVAPSAHAQTQTPPATSPPALTGHAVADSAQALLNFILTVNRDEIAAGKLAVSRASRADVRAFAQRVVDDHSKALAQWTDKAPGLSLTVADSASAGTKPLAAVAHSAAMANGISEVRDTTTAKRGGVGGAAIHSAHVAMLTDLQAATGADFDTRYIKAQAEGHDAVLKELELHPTTYTELQTMLTEFRATVSDHRAAARKLQP